MKIKIFTFLYIFCSFIGILNVHSQVPVPKVEKAYKYLPELIIKDSLFLQGIDSLVFNSFCPTIKQKKYKILDVYSKQIKDDYELYFNLVTDFQYNSDSILRGYFRYKDYLFIWFDAVPEGLWRISDKKIKLSYLKGVPFISTEIATFVIEYTQGKMELTGMCCF